MIDIRQNSKTPKKKKISHQLNIPKTGNYINNPPLLVFVWVSGLVMPSDSRGNTVNLLVELLSFEVEILRVLNSLNS